MADQIKLTLLAPISSALVQLPKAGPCKSSQHHSKRARTFPSKSQPCSKEVISAELINKSKRIGPALPIGSCNEDIAGLISRFTWGEKKKKGVGLLWFLVVGVFFNEEYIKTVWRFFSPFIPYRFVWDSCLEAVSGARPPGSARAVCWGQQQPH